MKSVNRLTVISADRPGWTCKHDTIRLQNKKSRLKIINKAMIYNFEVMSDNFLVMKILTNC
jgi:hypothetical protein